jgi:hypothetical protein
MEATGGQQSRTALVFGASGITGWAIMREAVRYPTSETFSHIIGLTNQPQFSSSWSSFLKEEERAVLVSGVDLTAGVGAVVEKLKGIENIGTVTDVFFSGVYSLPIPHQRSFGRNR